MQEISGDFNILCFLHEQEEAQTFQEPLIEK